MLTPKLQHRRYGSYAGVGGNLKKMNDKLITTFNSICSLSNEENNAILDILSEKHLKKGEFWMKEGVSNHNIVFIQSGYLRKFYLNEGNEITDSFYFENEFCADLPSILSRHQPSSNVISMEPTDLTVIPFDKFEKLCSKYYAFEHIYRVLLEYTFLRFYKRTRSFIEQTPKERYEAIEKDEPKILQKVNQYHIASYIGVSYQHLSRLRGKK